MHGHPAAVALSVSLTCLASSLTSVSLTCLLPLCHSPLTSVSHTCLASSLTSHPPSYPRPCRPARRLPCLHAGSMGPTFCWVQKRSPHLYGRSWAVPVSIVRCVFQVLAQRILLLTGYRKQAHEMLWAGPVLTFRWRCTHLRYLFDPARPYTMPVLLEEEVVQTSDYKCLQTACSLSEREMARG